MISEVAAEIAGGVASEVARYRYNIDITPLNPLQNLSSGPRLTIEIPELVGR